jgi:hypothetical protein
MLGKGALTVFAMALTPVFAVAQKIAPEAGKVIEVGGPVGAVIVVRGAQSYELNSGDLLFPGDRIVTRMNGSVKLSVSACEVSVDPTSSIVIDKDVCAVPPLTLAYSTLVIPGSPSLADPAAGSVGATPGVLTLLAASGAAAAAALDEDNAVE